MKTEAARILVVDDEPAVLGLLRHVLEEERHQVREAADGASCLCLARAERPDLILLDINLPDLSGFDVCRQLKEDAATLRIPVIFLTGAEQDESEFRSFGAGAADFLRKPVSRDRLCLRVRNVLESRAAAERLERQASDLARTNERLKESLIMQEQVRRTLLQRDQMLCAVNYVAKTFLQAPRWQEVIGEVLGCLGGTVNCEQAYFRLFASGAAQQQDSVWTRPGSRPSCLSMDVLAAWRTPSELLKNSRPLINVNCGLPAQVREALERSHIRSCLILPVQVGQTLRGCIGFDCGQLRRPWEGSLVQAMMISADVIGAAVQRELVSQERSRLAAAIKEFADCVLITDAEGRVAYANPACWSVTGWRPEELAGRSLSELPADGGEQQDWPAMLAAAAQDGQWHGGRRSRHRDGSLYEEAVTVAPVRDGAAGQVSGFCVIRRDQTEKKRLEAIAEAANLMENVGFVFSGVRHELANPLNSLKMALSVLRRQMDSLSREKIREFLDRSMGEISRMEYLLSALKNFNLLEEQRPAPLDLAAFAEKFKRLHEQDLRLKGIRLELRAEEPGPLRALADERALHQVLLNLLTNSVNALRKQPQPLIAITLARSKPRCVQLRFADNGCGISPQVRRQLFTPFFTTRINGTGLGLTLVKKMLTAMNGTVTIDGKEGEGAWALITLPEAPPENMTGK